MKKAAFIITALLILALLTGCGGAGKADVAQTLQFKTPAPTKTEAPMQTPEASEEPDDSQLYYYSLESGLMENYDDEDALKAKSDAIVTGCVVEQKNFFAPNGFFYTFQKYTVEEAFKGKLKAGQSITILEMGGKIDAKAYVQETGMPDPEAFYEHNGITSDDILIEGCDGYFPTKVGDKTLLFLKDVDSEDYWLPEDAYYLAGEYKGRLFQTEGTKYARPEAFNGENNICQKGYSLDEAIKKPELVIDISDLKKGLS